MASKRAMDAVDKMTFLDPHLELTRFQYEVTRIVDAALKEERQEARKQAAINLIDIANQSLNFADFKCRAMEYGDLTLADFQPREETEGDDIDSAMEAEKNG